MGYTDDGEETYEVQPSSETRGFYPELSDRFPIDGVFMSLADISKQFVMWHVAKKKKVPSVDLIQRVTAECYFARAGSNQSALEAIADYMTGAAFPSQ